MARIMIMFTMTLKRRSKKQFMKMNQLKYVLLLAGLALVGAAQAQVPQLINYQGRVVQGGTNFGGSGQFKFAFVQGAGPTLLWKNDGSAGNTEPAVSVTLPVVNGLRSEERRVGKEC